MTARAPSIWLALFGLAVSLSIGAGHAAECAATPAGSLQTTDGIHGELLVPADVDGQQLTFILDTGAPTAVMREGVAEQLGLQRSPIPLNMATGIGGRPFQESAVAHTVGLGGLKVSPVGFLLEPASHAADPVSAGLIGAELFRRYDLDLDLPHHRIRLYAPGDCRPAGMTALRANMTPGGHVLVDLQLDGERVTALIDTGASASVVTLDAAHRLWGLSTQTPGVMRIGQILGADGGRLDAYGYDFKGLVVGDIAIPHPSIVLMQDETRRMHHVLTDRPPQAEAEGLPELTLGLPQIRQLRLLIAYRDGVVYAARGAP